MRKAVGITLLCLALALLIVLIVRKRQDKALMFSFDPSHSTILRGVVSDYFRYGFNAEYPAQSGGLEKEFERLERLKAAGADINIVGLYLARLDKTRENIAEMDRYVEYAREHNMFVFLAPAGVGFRESNPKRKAAFDESYWQHVGESDLLELTELLARRYGWYSHVLYQLVAEPNMPNADWRVLQEKLATIVRKYTDNPIIVSTAYYSPYPALPILPFENIIYSTGGYVRKADGAPTERAVIDILGTENLRKDYPVLVAEFGGNYGGNFSSEEDLELWENLLAELQAQEMSFTAYRLSAAFIGDGLALFDLNDNLTAKGELFVQSFR